MFSSKLELILNHRRRRHLRHARILCDMHREICDFAKHIKWMENKSPQNLMNLVKSSIVNETNWKASFAEHNKLIKFVFAYSNKRLKYLTRAFLRIFLGFLCGGIKTHFSFIMKRISSPFVKLTSTKWKLLRTYLGHRVKVRRSK